jgi:hypothetical protein
VAKFIMLQVFNVFTSPIVQQPHPKDCRNIFLQLMDISTLWTKELLKNLAIMSLVKRLCNLV